MEKDYRSVLDLHRDLLGPGAFTDSLEKEIKGRQVSQAVFSIRNRRGLTQKQLADKMGLSQSAVSKFEASNDDKITVGELLRFSRALGISTELVIFDKKMKAADKVKYHWMKIKGELDGLVNLSHGDKEMERGVRKFTEEAFMNITSGLMRCLDRVKETGDKVSSGLKITGVTSNHPNKETATAR